MNEPNSNPNALRVFPKPERTMPAASRVDSLVNALSVSFPASVFLLACYCVLSNKAFGIAGLVGNRFHASLRRALAASYVFGACVLFAFLAASTAFFCWPETDLCAEHTLETRWCAVSAPSAMLVFKFAIWTDRVAVPLLKIRTPVFDTDLVQRVANAGGASMVWMGLCHRDPTSVLLLVLLCTRRALCVFERAASVVCGAIKALIAWHVLRALSAKTCRSSDDAVAVGCALAMVLA